MSDLEIILEHLKEEISNLRLELEQCLIELDYKAAHLYQKAINYKSTEANAIRNRLQPNNEEIRECRRKVRSAERKIEHLNKKLNVKIDNPRRKKYIENEINNYRKQIDSFSNQIIILHKSNKLRHIDNDDLIEAVEQLIDTDLDSIHLEVKDYYTNYISMINLENYINVEFIKSCVNKRAREVTPNYKIFLSKMGFTQNEYNTWTLHIDRTKTTKEQIILLISSICFDVIRTSKDTTCNLITK